ncbi:uncharacterized protein LOC103574431 [Microplitis demolitor]|uniref:uncharacterized protein LOC103574431 n=1 Tax=Microplitis demolitor TaxID=69319 RepID=UPI0004CCD76F|nr:uncharacterized protein LOC103574431 [Microplitis demolitor]
MSGTEKKKLLIIGKSQKPRCFKGVKSLPVDYANNRKAWITSEVFEKWLRDWDRDLVKKKKKVLLLVDNCPAHPNVTDLKSITLAFLPPNTTSLGFIESHNGLPIHISEHEFDEEDDIPLPLWSRNLNSDSLAAPEMWEDYVDIDSGLVKSEEPTDENIVQNISAKEQLESDGEEEVEEAPLPTAEEALKAAELLSRFVHSNIENDNLTIATCLLYTIVLETVFTIK